MSELASLFDPSRVAIAGATDTEGSIGRSLFENVLASFEGECVPVNPNRETVLGQNCYPDLLSVPDPVDLAVVAVPPEAVVEVVRDAGEAGIGAVVVITAGFGETEEGQEREAELARVAREHDIALVGPNCLGIISTPVGLNATFAEGDAAEGPISFFSQSGGFITAVLDWAAAHDLGFRHVVSLGNEAVLDEVDFVGAWGADPETEVVLGHVEDVVRGREFMDVASEATRDTPVLVVKGGRSAAGAEAAASHTGSLAGSDRAFDAAMRQAGVVRANNVEELFDFGRVLAAQPLPENDRVAILTNAGGPGVMAADAVSEASLELAEIGGDCRDCLAAALPVNASLGNPIDVIGDAPVDRFEAALDVLVDDDSIGSCLVFACPSEPLDYQGLADIVVEAANRGTPIVACLMGGELATRAARRLDAAGIPNFFDPDRAIGSLDALASVRRIQERPREEPGTFDVDRERARALVETALAQGRTQLGTESMELLGAYGIPTPSGELVSDSAGAAEAARAMGGPIVLKVVSPDIVHKSDIGGVAVDIEPEAAEATCEDLLARVRSAEPDASIDGVLVQEFVNRSDGTETIVGADRDPHFGPLLLFGLGGVFVEVLEDTAVRVAPVTEREARRMTEEVRSAPMLRGARGREPAAVDRLVEVIQRVSQLVTDVPEITELDLNPVVAAPDGVCAVDFRARLAQDCE
jgi:acetyl coenzyme A synthetase (ADP forming)-like protein